MRVFQIVLHRHDKDTDSTLPLVDRDRDLQDGSTPWTQDPWYFNINYIFDNNSFRLPGNSKYDMNSL